MVIKLVRVGAVARDVAHTPDFGSVGAYTDCVLNRLRPVTDEQLVARFRAGDDDAFAQISERFRPRLTRYAAGMLRGRGVDPEDAVQDVLVRAYGALRAGDRAMHLRPWLYRIAHNRCLDLLSREAPAELVADPEARGSSADDGFERSQRIRDLVDDIQGLPPQQRSALIIRELDGLAYDQIAEALDTTVPAVKSLLVRARMNLARAGELRDGAAAPATTRARQVPGPRDVVRSSA
jgi:RNA polymerase sigma factor (sigma-70 family)